MQKWETERVLKIAQCLQKKNIDFVDRMLMDDRRLNIDQIVNAISISRKRTENIMHDEFGLTNVSIWWVSHFLTPDKKLSKLIILRDNLLLFEANPLGFLEHLLSQDECHFEPERKR